MELKPMDAGNGRSFTWCRIGTLHVIEPFIVTQLYECAAWHEEREVQPDNYPVWCAWDAERGKPSEWYPYKHSIVTCRVRTVVVGSDFTSHFGGNRHGSKIDQNVGEAGSHCLSGNEHGFGASVADTGRAWGQPFEPCEGLHIAVENVERSKYAHSPHTIEPAYRWGLLRDQGVRP